MRVILSKLWADDGGAVVSAEVILIVSLTVIGIIPGLIALRNCENASLATMGNELLAIQTGFSFAPFTIEDASGNVIATYNGAEFSPGTPNFLVSSHAGASTDYTNIVVNPAP